MRRFFCTILHNLGILKEGQTYNGVTKTNGRVSSCGEKVMDMYIAATEKERAKPASGISERADTALIAHVDVSALEEIRLRKGRPLLLDFGRRPAVYNAGGAALYTAG